MFHPETSSKKKPNCIAFHFFPTIFSYKWAGYTSMNSMFWTNEKLSVMVAWSSSVSSSCFKVQGSIGHLVFFCSGNSIVSWANFWCPCSWILQHNAPLFIFFGCWLWYAWFRNNHLTATTSTLGHHVDHHALNQSPMPSTTSEAPEDIDKDSLNLKEWLTGSWMWSMWSWRLPHGSWGFLVNHGGHLCGRWKSISPRIQRRNRATFRVWCRMVTAITIAVDQSPFSSHPCFSDPDWFSRKWFSEWAERKRSRECLGDFCWISELRRPPMNGSHLVGPGENVVRVDREEVVRLEREDLVDWTTFCIEGILLPVLAIFGILGKESWQFRHLAGGWSLTRIWFMSTTWPNLSITYFNSEAEQVCCRIA